MNWKFGGVFALLVGASVSFAQQTCQQVYQNAVRDIDLDTRSQVQASEIFQEHCESNGSAKSSSLTVGIDATVKKIPLKFNLGSGSSAERLQSFCKSMASASFNKSDSYKYQSYVVTDALALMNQCLIIEKSGVRASHVVNGLTSVTVRFDFNAGQQQVVLRSVTYDETSAKCTTTAINGSPIAVTASLKQVTLKNSFAIVCRRIPTKLTDGTQVIKPLELSIDTNHGPYTVQLLGDRVYSYRSASQSMASIQSLNQANASLSASLSSAKDEQARLAAALAESNARYQNLQNGFDKRVEYHRVTQSQGSTVACAVNGGDLTAYMQKICGPRLFGGKYLLLDTPGRRCGYQTYVFICITL